jgi:hypothetical protein
MNWLSRQLARMRRHRRISAARSVNTPLREFVYLDEVSVYSLLASRQGALAAEYTDTRTNSAKNELASKLTGSGGVIKGEVSSKVEETRTQSTQTLRKSTVQAAFKEFFEGEENRLAISPPDRNLKAPRVQNSGDLSGPEFHEWVTNEKELNRGDLIELEVELQTHRVFKISSIMTELWSILNDNPELFPDGSQPELKKFAAVNRVLGSLLVGLIPVECEVVDYQVLEVGGSRLIVHKSILSQLSNDERSQARPLLVAGVAEERLFWKDIRRLLFANSKFRILCRLNRSGLQDSWVPVKLLDVLGDVVPDLANQLEILAKHAFSPAHDTNSVAAETFDRVKAALDSYHNLLSQKYNVDQDLVLAMDNTELAMRHHADFERYDSRLAAFREATSQFSTTYGVEVDPFTSARLRSTALSDALLSVDGTFTPLPSAPRDVVDMEEKKAILDTEIVAIYW